mmetsp:Transcript_6134/g.9844  ORF Transcript_6134/g.9844 Transcript_6134/m.9844 type:complete len:133 (-) Transcript_6134:2131-2529(-)
MSFGTLTFKQYQDADKVPASDALFSPTALQVPKLLACDTLQKLVSKLESQLLKELPKRNLDLSMSKDCLRIIEGFDFYAEIDKTAWVQMDGYKQMDTPIFDSNLPGIDSNSTLRAMGFSKYASSIKYGLKSF